MRKIYLLSTLVLASVFCTNVSAQDFSNKGKDFWVAYGYHQVMTSGGGGGAQDMVLYFAAETQANVTVSIPGLGYTATYVVPANTTIASTPIPKVSPQDARLAAASTAAENKGIHITSDKPIVAYAHIYNSSVSGSTILYPTNTLGKDYYSVNFTNNSNTGGANCWFYVIATDPGTTTVEITPSADAINHPANVTFSVNLTQGQVYNVMGLYGTSSGSDLTGSRVQSVNTGSGCKKIAVFSGSGRIAIGCNTGTPSSDNYMVQAMPRSAWGKRYLTTPIVGYSVANGNTSSPSTVTFYRVCVADPTTVVKINGVVTALPLTNNFYYQVQATTAPLLIEADKPITVAQYFPSQASANCGTSGGDGDPEVIYLSPIEQSISKVLWNASARYSINQSKHYINCVIPNGGTAISSFKLDGTPVPPASWVVHPADPAYSYIRLNVTSQQGSPTANTGLPHIVESDSGFNAIAYGYGGAESYGYNAGTNIKDIFQYVSVENQYATVNFPATCKNSPFYFSMTFPYQPTSIDWDFHGLFPNFSMPNPALYFVGSTVVAGKTLYQYKIPSSYTIPNTGVFPITVYATNPTADNCGGEQVIDYDVQVFNEPVADFTAPAVCFPNQVSLTENNNTDGRPITTKYWDFGDLGPTGNTTNPTHSYAAPGAYTVRYALTTDIGCISDTTEHVVNVNPVPTATMAAATVIEVCKNGTPPEITFTGAGGTAPYTFTYTINGGPNLTISSVGASPSVNLQVPTTIAGAYTYRLVKVEDNTTTRCGQNQTSTVVINVNELPTSSLAGAVTVCQNAPSPNITFTGAGGTAPYTFTYTINSGAPQSITTFSGNSVTLAVPTTTPGTFVYSVTDVSDNSSLHCSNVQSGVSTTVQVNGLPDAVASGTAELCVGATSSGITFTGSGGTGPYEFTYTINGGSPITISGNPSVNIPVSTATAGTFTYTLVSVKDGSPTACSKTLAASPTTTASITVNPLPTPDFNITNALCEGDALTFNSTSSPNVGTITNLDWDFGDATPIANGTNPTHTYATAGSYTVKLTATNSKGCISNPVLSRTIQISVKPVADFDIPQTCVGDPFAQFNDLSTVSTGSVTGWNWDFGDPTHPPNTSTAQNGQHTYVATGVYPVTLTAISDKGCKNSKTQNLTINSQFPVSDFTPQSPANLCANDSVAIKDAATINFGSITKIEIYWDYLGAPGTVVTDASPVPGKIYKHKYPDFQSPLTKTYRVRYVAYSGGTCSNIRERDITVNASPKVAFLDMPAACFDASAFQITQASEIGGVPGTPTYSGPGVTSSGIFTPSVADIGTHTIKYLFTSTAAGCKDSLSKTITVLDTASAQFTLTNAACERSAVNFSSTSSTIPAGVGTITGWNWDFGDPASSSNTSTSQNPSHTFTGWGSYNVKLSVTTSNGCKSTVRTVPVTVNPVPRPRFDIPPSACLPSATVAFNNTSSIPDGTQAGFTYLWNFDDPASGALNTSTGTSPSHIYNSVGPFNVNLEVTSTAGCKRDTTIILNTLHPQPTGSFTVSKKDVCIGQSITFTDNSNPADGSIQSYTWDLGNSTTRTLPGFTYTYPSAGEYDVKLFITNSHGCKSTVATQHVTINSYPVVNGGPDLYILEGGSDTLHPVVTATNPTFQWSPNQYFLSSTTIRDAIVKGVADITYTLTVTGQGDCIATGSVNVKVLKGPEIPNIFSPNGDGVHDKWIIKFLDTYPGCTVEIFNRYGQVIFRSTGYGTPWDGTVDGKPVPIGTYYYIVNPKNGRSIMSGYVDVIR